MLGSVMVPLIGSVCLWLSINCSSPHVSVRGFVSDADEHTNSAVRFIEKVEGPRVLRA
jgi:hypothetical protein